MARILQTSSGAARSLTTPQTQSQTPSDPFNPFPVQGAAPINPLAIAKSLPGAQLGDEIGNSISALGGAASYALHGKFGDAANRLQSGVEQQHPLKTVADTANVASLIATGPEAFAAKSFAGRTAVNAAVGAFQGGTNAVVNGGNVGKEAVIGAGLNAGLGAIGDIPGALASSRAAKVPQAVDALEAKYRELAGTTTKTSKILAKSNSTTEAKNLAGTTGKPVERTLAEAGIIPKQDPANPSRLATVEQADQFRKTLTPLHDTLKDAIKAVSYSVQPTPIAALETSAIHRVANQSLTEGDKLSMIQGIKKEFGLLRDKHGDAMTIGEMADAKSPYWGKTKFDSTKPLQSDINYQIGKSFQKGIEDAATKGGFEDVAQLNREIGDRLEAARFLESLNGKIVEKGQLGKYALQGMGAIAGASHGPLGSIVGGVIGDTAANMLISNAVASPAKRLILARLERQDPAVYTKAVKWLEQHGQAQALQLKLPEGAPLGSPGNPHINTQIDRSGIVPGSSRAEYPPKVEGGVPSTQIPKELQPLATEAKKYKSADSFIKAQGKPLYHGSSKAEAIRKEGFKLPTSAKEQTDAPVYGDGVYFSTKRSGAYDNTHTGVNTIEGYVPNDMKLYQTQGEKDAFNINTQSLKKQGYDGVEVSLPSGEKHIVVFDPAKITTREQLISVYDRVHGTVTDNTPMVLRPLNALAKTSKSKAAFISNAKLNGSIAQALGERFKGEGIEAKLTDLYNKVHGK